MLNTALLLLFTLLGSCALTGVGAARQEKGVIFKKIDDQEIKTDIYFPRATGPRPAVVVNHGGSWNRRSGDMTAICRQLVAAGFVVFNATYRYSPKYTFPAPVDDVRDLVRWVRDHAEKYGVQADNISAWGYSAGSNLILLAGLEGDLGLRAIVSGGTPADLTAWPHSKPVKAYIGHSIEDRRDLWEAASPLHHITDHTPPIFFYHGSWDHLVEVEQMHKIVAALEKAHRPVESFEVPFMGHIAVYILSQNSVERGVRFLRRAAYPQ